MNNPFPILAVETSGDLCSVAVMFDEKNYSEINILQKHIHSEKLLLMIEYVLTTSNLLINDISQIAVSIGPGSFTGLRIGLAAVKGIAFGSEKPIVPVPTFDAFAFKISTLINNAKFAIINNVNTDELYYAEYEKINGEKIRSIKELSLIRKDELETITKDVEYIYGNFSHPKVFNKTAFPSALDIAKWAYLFGKELLTYNYDYLEPNYFKKFTAKVKT